MAVYASSVGESQWIGSLKNFKDNHGEIKADMDGNYLGISLDK